MTDLLPTDQMVFHLPGGYRWATADEVEIHLNVEEIPHTVWVDKGSEQCDMAVPRSFKPSLGQAQYLSHDLSEYEG